MIKATKHKNWHVVVETYNNIIFVVKLLIVEKAFEKILDRDSRDNVVGNTNMDLFQKMAVLAGGVCLQNDIC